MKIDEGVLDCLDRHYGSQAKAAEALGFKLRTYQRYRSNLEAREAIVLALTKEAERITSTSGDNLEEKRQESPTIIRITIKGGKRVCRLTRKRRTARR